MKKVFLTASIAFSLSLVFIACGDTADKNSNATDPAPAETAATESETSAYDPHRGEGKFHDVELGDKLDVAMADKGEKISNLKCQSCHKMTDERLVGPGWKDVTKRHRPEWLMNFMTNTDEMIDKDPKAQEMLEICMVRMPDQNLTDDEAREILEYMRKNDGVK